MHSSSHSSQGGAGWVVDTAPLQSDCRWKESKWLFGNLDPRLQKERWMINVTERELDEGRWGAKKTSRFVSQWATTAHLGKRKHSRIRQDNSTELSQLSVHTSSPPVVRPLSVFRLLSFPVFPRWGRLRPTNGLIITPHSSPTEQTNCATQSFHLNANPTAATGGRCYQSTKHLFLF